MHLVELVPWSIARMCGSDTCLRYESLGRPKNALRRQSEKLEKEVGTTSRCEHTRHPEDLHRYRMVLADELRNRATQPTCGGRLLDAHNARGLTCGGKERALIDRLNCRHVENPGRNPYRPQLPGGHQSARNHGAGRHDREVVAARKHGCLANPEMFTRGCYRGDLIASYAQIAWHRSLCSPTEGLAGLLRIRRHDYRQVCNSTKPRQVFDRMVSWAEGSVRQAGAHPAQNHVHPAVGDVHLYLFQSAPSQERRRGTDNRHEPTAG